jgi:hypothetical protein
MPLTLPSSNVTIQSRNELAVSQARFNDTFNKEFP